MHGLWLVEGKEEEMGVHNELVGIARAWVKAWVGVVQLDILSIILVAVVVRHACTCTMHEALGVMVCSLPSCMLDEEAFFLLIMIDIHSAGAMSWSRPVR